MEDAAHLVAQYGPRAVPVLRAMIETALGEGDEVQALRLDEILMEVEKLVEDLPG